MEDNKYKDVVLTRTANSGEQTCEYDEINFQRCETLCCMSLASVAFVLAQKLSWQPDGGPSALKTTEKKVNVH